jgi:hypothetical protein
MVGMIREFQNHVDARQLMPEGEFNGLVRVGKIQRFLGNFGPIAKAHQVQLRTLVLQEDFHRVASWLPILVAVPDPAGGG